MAKAFEEQLRQPDTAALDLRVGSASCSIARSPSATTGGSKHGCSCQAPLCLRLRHRGYRSTAHRAASTRLFAELSPATGSAASRNLIYRPDCGIGKTWLACALGHKACRDTARALPSHAAALRGSRARPRRRTSSAACFGSLSRVDLLILDDWGPAPLTAGQRRDLLEIVDDRHGAAPP